MARFKNQSRVRQQVYLPSIHARLIARRPDGSEIKSWDHEAGKTIIDPDQIIEAKDAHDIELLRRLTHERTVRVQGERKKQPAPLVELEEYSCQNF